MINYDMILFDLDGTLTDPKIGITKSVQYALAKLNIQEDNLDKLEAFIGPPLVESFQEFYALTSATAQQALIYYREYFVKIGMYENFVYPGIPQLLQELTKHNKKLIVATSKPTVFSETILKYFQLAHYFPLVIGSNLDGTRVAKTEIIACILEEVADDSGKVNVVMVGDRQYDIIGAKNNNIDSIAVSYGYGSLAELTAAEPDYIVHSVPGLRRILLG